MQQIHLHATTIKINPNIGNMKYENLPFVPRVMAMSVCGQPYTGNELRNRLDGDQIAKVEAVRAHWTVEQVQAFVEKCDVHCRSAFAAKSPWFMFCVSAKGNGGRDKLYAWITHWMVAYIVKNY